MTRTLDALTDLAGIIRDRALAEYAAASKARRDLEAERRALAAAARATPVLNTDVPNGVSAAQAEVHAQWARDRAAALAPALARAAAREETARLRAARALGRGKAIDGLSDR